MKHLFRLWTGLARVFLVALTIAMCLPFPVSAQPLTSPTEPEGWSYYFPNVHSPTTTGRMYIEDLLRAPFIGLSPLAKKQGVQIASQAAVAPATPPEATTVQPTGLCDSSTEDSDTAVGWDLETCAQIVTRRGDQLYLAGQPFTFVGTNVSYLLEDYFPEEEVEKVVSYLAGAGVTALRVWLYPQHSLDRAERLFDLGGRYGVRFIVTLDNYYWDKGAWWFDNSDRLREEYLPHVRETVMRFRGRAEIMMWELMNEPNCSGDIYGNCPAHLVRWATQVSQEIKALDPCHLISVGVMRIDPTRETYLCLHAIPTIDVISVHRPVGVEYPGEMEIARELNKPIFVGEAYSEAYDEGCRLLYDGVLAGRADKIAADLAQSLAEGVDGYLLWQYGHGQVVRDGEVNHYCGTQDYMRDDPVWEVLRQAPVSRPN